MIETGGKSPEEVAPRFFEASRAGARPDGSHPIPSLFRSRAVFVNWPVLAVWAGFFLIGTVVGSFLNVCIYRIPWQKSVIWPAVAMPAVSGGDRGRSTTSRS